MISAQSDTPFSVSSQIVDREIREIPRHPVFLCSLHCCSICRTRVISHITHSRTAVQQLSSFFVYCITENDTLNQHRDTKTETDSKVEAGRESRESRSRETIRIYNEELCIVFLFFFLDEDLEQILATVNECTHLSLCFF